MFPYEESILAGVSLQVVAGGNATVVHYRRYLSHFPYFWGQVYTVHVKSCQSTAKVWRQACLSLVERLSLMSGSESHDRDFPYFWGQLTEHRATNGTKTHVSCQGAVLMSGCESHDRDFPYCWGPLTEHIATNGTKTRVSCRGAVFKSGCVSFDRDFLIAGVL